MGVGSVLRWRVRQHKKLVGHMLEDVVAHILCPCCAIIQVGGWLGEWVGGWLGEWVGGWLGG